MKISRLLLCGAGVLSGCTPVQPGAEPSGVAIDPVFGRGVAAADSMIAASIGTLTPGAVFLVAKDGRVVHERAFGYAQLNDYQMHPLDSPRVMRTSTMFDLASVTKVMATTFATMLLVDRGEVDLDAPVSRYLSDFRGPHLD